MRINKQQLALALCVLFMVALIYTRFLVSVSMFGLAFVGLFDWNKIDGKLKIRLNPVLLQNLKQFGNQPAYWMVTLFFLLVLLSGWQTEDWSYWIERLRIKLPFLILPIAFLGLPVFTRRQYLGLTYFLLILLCITCIGIGINYLLDFAAINESIKHGKAVPTPCNHIRFSLLLSLGIICGGWLWRERYYTRYTWERYFIKFATLFLFGFIFFLAVRSGLASLYAGLLVLLIHFVNTTQQYLKAAAMVATLIAMPVIAYLFFPTFNAKVGYVKEDLEMHTAGKGENYSDSGRFTSILLGLQLAGENPLQGVGAGNLRQEMRELYAQEYPQAPEIKLPHNQFVWVFAGTGLVGLFLFSLAFFYPILYNNNYRQPLFLAFNVVIFCSFLTESTIENSLGVALYSFFLLLGLNYITQYCPQTNLLSSYGRLRRAPNLVR